MVVVYNDKLSETTHKLLLIIAIAIVELSKLKVGGFVATHTPKGYLGTC
jgi:hypothetical protein